MRQHTENFVIRVSTRQKYAVDVNNVKVFLNLKRIKKVSLVKYPEEVNAGYAVNAKNPYQGRQDLNMKRLTLDHLSVSHSIVLFVKKQ